MPINIHIKNLNQVMAGKKVINAPQDNMPNTGINGFHGFLNGRLRSGWRMRNTITPTHTITKLAKVPMLTVSANSPSGMKPATRETINPHIRIIRVGVWRSGLIFEKIGEIKPSRLIANRIRVKPYSSTSNTVMRPASTPVDTKVDDQVCPILLKANARGAETLSSV